MRAAVSPVCLRHGSYDEAGSAVLLPSDSSTSASLCGEDIHQAKGEVSPDAADVGCFMVREELWAFERRSCDDTAEVSVASLRDEVHAMSRELSALRSFCSAQASQAVSREQALLELALCNTRSAIATTVEDLEARLAEQERASQERLEADVFAAVSACESRASAKAMEGLERLHALVTKDYQALLVGQAYAAEQDRLAQRGVKDARDAVAQLELRVSEMATTFGDVACPDVVGSVLDACLEGARKSFAEQLKLQDQKCGSLEAALRSMQETLQSLELEDLRSELDAFRGKMRLGLCYADLQRSGARLKAWA